MKPTLALLGAGIFVRSDYGPSLRELSDLISLRAIWSRSKESATETAELVSDFAPDIMVKWGEDGLNEILKDPSIHAVAVVLSAQIHLDVVLKALEAGKHVLQEKPVGTCVSQVRGVFSTYSSLSMFGGKPPIWAVAENFRFEPALIEAADWVKGIGDLTVIEVMAHIPMNEDNMYFMNVTTSWRKEFKGALPLDAGVHYVAAIKMITGCGIKSVAAIARHTDSKLSPPDTVTTLLQLDNGCAGVFTMSFHGSLKEEVIWRVLGSKGEVRIELVTQGDKIGYKTQLIPADRDKASLTSFHPIAGVTEELRAFGADVASVVFENKGSSLANPRGSVQEAIDDVAVIEAIFKSSASIEGFVHVEKPEFGPTLHHGFSADSMASLTLYSDI